MRPDAISTPLRSDWDVAGHPTCTLWWPARSQKAETVILFIPGNPGLIDYYTEFLEKVYQQASPNVEIFGVSQLGMSASSPPDKEYTFQEQIDHKVFCFDMLQKANPDARIIIMGHSIGAYLAAEVVKQRPTAVSRVFGLFPCLYDIGKTPKGIRIQRYLLRLPQWVLTGLGTVLSYLPPPLLEGLVGAVTKHKGHILKVTASLCNRSTIRTVIRMAHQEMRLVKQLDHHFYSAHMDKFVLYYSPTDGWAPLEHYRTLKAAYPNHKHFYLCEKGLQHDFSLNTNANIYMAHKVIEWMRGGQDMKF
ncbi:hypothetical protein RO3G_13677 [Lichtheimia corymbifera JMRC:FSU:9682]|uniref:Lipid droplet-associated hydrolase n=1 Tax=Lichtheimia corymbifera JMRC:FSU:9682 TaxID=1263082 RepID=A0A068S5C9_9FUNG|nr:hypothetical protein RO3G_13677 [Lichtheimia corymbifera JMRC:FSU:9682]